MADSNIFNGQGTPPDQTQSGAANPQPVQSNDAYANLLNDIKNERGEPKYKDVQTALDALKHSQEFIPQIKNENEQMKAELERLRLEAARIKELEDTLARLSSGQNPQTQATPAQQGLDAEAVAKLVSQTLERQEKEKTAKQNTQTVVAKMAEVFGADAEKVFYQKAQEMGLTAEQVNDLAAKSPQAVFNLYGMANASNKQTNFQAPSTGSINTSAYQPAKESHLGRNASPVILGATTGELMQERERAKLLVEELHNNGVSTYDLTDPKTYFKYFNK